MTKGSLEEIGWRSALAVPIIAVAGLASSGCGHLALKSLEDPSSVGLLERQAAQARLCLDSAYPQNAQESKRRLEENAKRLLPDAADVVLTFPAVVGVNPAQGKYFGQQTHSPLIRKDRNYSGEAKNPERALLIHPFNWVATLFENILDLKTDVVGVAGQTGNLVARPLYSSPSGRDRWFSDTKDGNPNNDRLESAWDNTAGSVGDVARSVFYVFDSGDAPDTLNYGMDKARGWAGYSLGERDKKLDQKFSKPGQPHKKDAVRMAINAGPFESADRFIYGVTQDRDYSRVVPMTSGRYIPSQKRSDWYWLRHLRGRERTAPGKIDFVNDRANFTPTEPPIYSLFRDFLKTIFFIRPGKSSDHSGNPGPTPESGLHGYTAGGSGGQ